MKLGIQQKADGETRPVEWREIFEDLAIGTALGIWVVWFLWPVIG